MRNSAARWSLTLCLTLSLLAPGAATAQEPPAQTQPSLPHLAKRGRATQLIVDGKPWLILGGETNNTVSSDLSAMETIWPRLKRMHLNTVLVAVAWDWVEPEEGKFDFRLVDELLAGARKNDLRVVLLWFGSWKNSVSSFVPAWVKADQKRFPRVRIKGGRAVEILSPFSDANREADQRAYVALMRHVRQADAGRNTVIMMQMQNEVGVLGDSRDRSEPAEVAFRQPVPQELMAYLRDNRERLYPDLRRLWESAGAKIEGSWTDVFGDSPSTDEIFMAWHYARYMDAMSKAGKDVHPLPVFTNTWIVQPEDERPGDYPSGGPEPLVIDVWRAGAPAIDFNAPDIYLPEFALWLERFDRPNNPLFVPEARGDATGAANAFYAIGRHASMGYSPFGIDSMSRLLPRPEQSTTPAAVATTAPLAPTLSSSPSAAAAAAAVDVESLPLPRAYAVLEQLAPLILEHQASGRITGASLGRDKTQEQLRLGDYLINVSVRRNRLNPSQAAPLGYGLFIQTGPDEYFVAGNDIQVTFTPAGDEQAIAGLARVEAGTFKDGKWTPSRILSGDDVLLDYKLAGAAEKRQSGSGLRFDSSGPRIQRVTLYKYR